MNQIQTTTIIRQRGQLTIPSPIRAKRKWASPQSVVTITTTKPDEITIRPHSPVQRKINWGRLWRDIRRVRSFRGKGGNLAQFIAKDRARH